MLEYFRKNKLFTEVLLHIAFWLIHFVTRLYLTGYFLYFSSEILNTQLILLPLRIIVAYFTIYIILYKYLFNKKVFQAIFLLISSMVIALLVRRVIVYYILYGLNIYPQPPEDPDFFNLLYILHYSISIYTVVTIAAIITLAREWFNKEKIRMETVQQKLRAELKYLKAQIHPHFLFNTINNIYSLALDKSEKTPGALLKLSELLNYIIYESNTDVISLEKEIDNLSVFIDLEKIRYDDKLDLQFKYSVKTKNITIPPLLLLPFVENSFKHGASESISNSWIHISLNEENKKLTFKVENSVDRDTEVFEEEKEGIGLNNVRRRLELLFKDKYELKTLHSPESYLVVLKINLDNEQNEN